MSEPVEQLIRDLSHDLEPVRVLPGLSRVAAVVLGAMALLTAVYVPWGLANGVLMPESAGIWDLVALAGHLLLGAGALALALGSSGPGRDLLEARGRMGLGFGAVITAAAVGAVLSGVPIEGIGGTWLAGTALCTCTAVVLAAIPAILVARVARRAAPHRLGRTLFFGAVSMLAFGALPGHVGCAMPGALHTVWGHMLVPLTGALLIWTLMRLAYGSRVSA